MWTSLPLSVIFNFKTTFFVNRSYALSRFFIVFLRLNKAVSHISQSDVCLSSYVKENTRIN